MSGMSAAPRWTLSEDGLSLKLTMPTSPIPVEMSLSADEIDDLLRGLAAARSTMRDQVPLTLEPSFIATAIADPAWRMSRSEYGPTLTLRHPGFGWQTYVLPPAECCHLAAWMLRTATDQPSPPAAAPDALKAAP